MLEWLGVKTIVIDCNDVEPKIIMRMKMAKDGENYILNLLNSNIVKTKQPVKQTKAKKG